jgi:hypothetical protein
MDTEFIVILQKLVAEQGKETLLNTAKCKAFLSDYTRGEFKKESRVFLLALDAGVQKAIDTAENISVCKKQQIRMLHEDFYLVEKVATNIVDTLAFILRGDTTKTAVKPEAEKATTKKPTAKKKTKPRMPVIETTQKTETQASETLDPNIKYRNLFEAYKDGKLPFAQGYIISSFFSETSSYSIYEIVSYARLWEIFVTAEGLQFATSGKKLYILVEPPTYHLKHQEPVSRSKSSGEFIPLRFNELDIITTKNQTKIMIAKEPIESFGSFTVLEPKGSNFAVVFYQLPDMFVSIATFIKESLKKQRKVAESDAREAARRIAMTIEKSMEFKAKYE